jgi:hypothetical protein
VVARFSELPLEQWHAVPNEDKRRFGIAKGAGVSVVRANREIAYGWHLLGDKRKENYDDWWRCEIIFDPQLDEQFGVTHSKQGIRPSPELDSTLGRDLERIAHDLNRRVRQRYALIRSSDDGAATAVARSKDVLLPPTSPKASRVGSWEERVPARPGYLIVFETVTGGDFYNARRRSGKIELVINSEHPFYKRLYGPLLLDPSRKHDRFSLECLLLALARVDVSRASREDRESAQRRRSHWSDVLAAFLQRK